MDQTISQLQQNLEQIKRMTQDAEPIEFWSARDLMRLFGYNKWQKFTDVINKAIYSSKLSGELVASHFLPARVKSTGGRPKEDFFLTRYACYLVAQNGDSHKPQIALAQTYFANQTRKQELQELRALEDARLEARAKLKETESAIESTVYQRGIKKSVEFATFKNKHIEALYGGLSINQLKNIRGIPKARSLADFDSHVELKAKDFALAMTDHNIKQKNINGQAAINAEVVKNSKETRQALLNRGITPELISPEEDLKRIATRRQKEQIKLGE